MENLRGAKIVKQDSSMVENSHLYVKAKDGNYCELTIVDENGKKRKVGAYNVNSGGVTGNYIPLTGTEEGKPITGDIEFSGYNKGIFKENPSEYGKLYLEDDGGAINLVLKHIDKSTNQTSFFKISPNIFGILSDKDYSDVAPNDKRIYAQRSYVDKKTSPYIEVTYSDLINLKNNSQLQKGKVYLLTDYMTTYTQPITNVSKSSGVIEPLIITATDVNKLHNQCKSTLYPQDIVYYEITGDIGNGYGKEGFTKGKIYRRIDIQRNNDIGTDWRHVKYDRGGVDKLLFQNYNECYNNTIKTYHLFNNVVGESFSHNIIGDIFVNNTIGDFFSNNNIGDVFANNIIVGEEFIGNIIKNDFYNNHIGGYFSKNIINGYFRNNVIGEEFIYNTVGAFFINVGSQASPFLSRNTEFRNHIPSNFTATPEIQNLDIDVIVFKSPNGTLKQRYYDDSNNLVINNL